MVHIATYGMLAGVLTAGQVTDRPMMIPVLEQIRVARPRAVT
ncbi:MAG: hypothetical protein Q4A20_11820 [Actinomyces sp.]|nr:hypothetical protein [Actinomyces sp.]